MFSRYGFINVAIASKVADNIEISTLESYGGSMIVYHNEFKDKFIFPDKLKNLHGYKYRIILHLQPPRVVLEDGMIKTPMIYFLDQVAKIQNATSKINFIKNHNHLPYFWDNRLMDLTFNTAVNFPSSNYLKLLTYEETAYCALVPRPPKISISEFIFVQPFDAYTWLFLILTITCCGVVWKLFDHRGAVNSHWLLIYGIFVMFIGQSVKFSRNNRTILAILLELIIFMTFVLNTVYEGVITSFMIQPTHENLLETFDQILASKYDILTDKPFIYAVRNSEDFKVAMTRFNTSTPESRQEYFNELKQQRFVFIRKCDFANQDITERFLNGEIVADYYYLLPEMILKYYIRLEASFLNPFIERLQYYMDLSFQAGLPYFWKVLLTQKKLNQQTEATVKYLKLNDLTQVFYIFFAGCLTAIGFLLAEIFLQNFLKDFMLTYLCRRLKTKVNQLAYKRRKPRQLKSQKGPLYYILHQHKKIKRLRKLKVRKIYVQS